MHVRESVVLPLPSRIREIALAALLFSEQYRVSVRIEIQGWIQDEHNQACLESRWLTVAEMDADLDIVGLEDPVFVPKEHADDSYRWVIPIGPGKLRISELEEE